MMKAIRVGSKIGGKKFLLKENSFPLQFLFSENKTRSKISKIPDFHNLYLDSWSYIKDISKESSPEALENLKACYEELATFSPLTPKQSELMLVLFQHIHINNYFQDLRIRSNSENLLRVLLDEPRNISPRVLTIPSLLSFNQLVTSDGSSENKNMKQAIIEIFVKKVLNLDYLECLKLLEDLASELEGSTQLRSVFSEKVLKNSLKKSIMSLISSPDTPLDTAVQLLTQSLNISELFVSSKELISCFEMRLNESSNEEISTSSINSILSSFNADQIDFFSSRMLETFIHSLDLSKSSVFVQNKLKLLKYVHKPDCKSELLGKLEKNLVQSLDEGSFNPAAEKELIITLVNHFKNDSQEEALKFFVKRRNKFNNLSEWFSKFEAKLYHGKEILSFLEFLCEPEVFKLLTENTKEFVSKSIFMEGLIKEIHSIPNEMKWNFFNLVLKFSSRRPKAEQAKFHASVSKMILQEIYQKNNELLDFEKPIDLQTFLYMVDTILKLDPTYHLLELSNKKTVDLIFYLEQYVKRANYVFIKPNSFSDLIKYLIALRKLKLNRFSEEVTEQYLSKQKTLKTSISDIILALKSLDSYPEYVSLHYPFHELIFNEIKAATGDLDLKRSEELIKALTIVGPEYLKNASENKGDAKYLHNMREVIRACEVPVLNRIVKHYRPELFQTSKGKVSIFDDESSKAQENKNKPSKKDKRQKESLGNKSFDLENNTILINEIIKPEDLARVSRIFDCLTRLNHGGKNFLFIIQKLVLERHMEMSPSVLAELLCNLAELSRFNENIEKGVEKLILEKGLKAFSLEDTVKLSWFLIVSNNTNKLVWNTVFEKIKNNELGISLLPTDLQIKLFQTLFALKTEDNLVEVNLSKEVWSKLQNTWTDKNNFKNHFISRFFEEVETYLEEHGFQFERNGVVCKGVFPAKLVAEGGTLLLVAERNYYVNGGRMEKGQLALWRRIFKTSKIPYRLFEYSEWDAQEKRHERKTYLKKKLKGLKQKEEFLKRKFEFNY